VPIRSLKDQCDEIEDNGDGDAVRETQAVSVEGFPRARWSDDTWAW